MKFKKKQDQLNIKLVHRLLWQQPWWSLCLPNFDNSASDLSRSRSPRAFTRAKLQIGIPLFKSWNQINWDLIRTFESFQGRSYMDTRKYKQKYKYTYLEYIWHRAFESFPSAICPGGLGLHPGTSPWWRRSTNVSVSHDSTGPGSKLQCSGLDHNSTHNEQSICFFADCYWLLIVQLFNLEQFNVVPATREKASAATQVLNSYDPSIQFCASYLCHSQSHHQAESHIWHQWIVCSKSALLPARWPPKNWKCLAWFSHHVNGVPFGPVQCRVRDLTLFKCILVLPEAARAPLIEGRKEVLPWPGAEVSALRPAE